MLPQPKSCGHTSIRRQKIWHIIPRDGTIAFIREIGAIPVRVASAGRGAGE
jgi:hypothetical protein